MQRFLHDPARYQVGYPVIAKNSEQFSEADPVTIDSNGFLTVATAGDKIIGYATENYTAASDNQTVAAYCPQYVYADGVEMAYTSDQDCTQTDIGAYADLTGTTGAIQVNLAAGTTGQFLVLGFDPFNESDDDFVVVTVAESQRDGFTQD